MTTVIDALIVTFGMDPAGIEKGSKEATGHLETLKSNALSIFAAIGGVALFTGLMKSSFDAAIAAGVLADSLGEDVEQINAMGQAVAAQGGTVEGFNDSLGNLNAAVGEMAAGFGGPGKDAFEKFGISMRDANGDMRKSSDVLLDLSDHLSKMTIGEAVAIGETMGIDAATIKSIHGGKDATLELIKAQKEKGVMDKESIEAAKKTKESMNAAKANIERASSAILQMLSPAIEMLANGAAFVADKVSKAFKKISDFVEEHSAVITVAIGAAAAIFAGIYASSIAKATAAMIRLGIATLIANLPLILMVAAIALVSAAIGLLVEDFLVWKEGGESAFGGVYQAVSDFWAKVKPIVDLFVNYFSAGWAVIWEACKLAFNFIKGLFTGDFTAFYASIDGLKTKFSELWEAAKNLAKPFFDWVSEKFGGLGSVVSGIAKYFGLGGEEGAKEGGPEPGAPGANGSAAPSAKEAVSPADAAAGGAPGANGKDAPSAKDAVSPAAVAAGAGAGNKTVTVTQQVTATVNTQATDGKGVASALNGAAGNELQNLVNTMDSGVMQ